MAEQESIPTRTVDTESIMKQLADYVKIQKGTELTEMEMQLHLPMPWQCAHSAGN